MAAGMERGEGSLSVDALLAQTSQFWTWLLWRKVIMIFLDSLMLRSQEWEVQRGHQRSGSCSTSPRMMMLGSTSTHTAETSHPRLVSLLISLLITILVNCEQLASIISFIIKMCVFYLHRKELQQSSQDSEAGDSSDFTEEASKDCRQEEESCKVQVGCSRVPEASCH